MDSSLVMAAEFMTTAVLLFIMYRRSLRKFRGELHNERRLTN